MIFFQVDDASLVLKMLIKGEMTWTEAKTRWIQFTGQETTRLIEKNQA